MRMDLLLRRAASDAVTTVTGKTVDQAFIIAADAVEMAGAHGAVTAITTLCGRRISGDTIISTRFIVTN